jgi:hypothetical protein
LSLCNDADYLTPAGFRRLDRFLSSREDTEWGPGLGLHLGGSFFMFRSPGSPSVFTVFDGLTSTVTDDGEYILDCARRGLLDVLHTYGDFSDPSHFNRRMAETAVDALRSRGVKIETWVNHGPPTNVQCLGTRHGWQGDAVGTPAYHADLTISSGVRWVWTGSEIVDHIALDASNPKLKRLRGLLRRPVGLGRNSDHTTALVEPLELRDGQRTRRFYRYGGLGGNTPVLDDLPRQLSSRNLRELVRAQGYAVVYQHLAVRRRRPGFGPEAYGPVDETWFVPEELTALRELAQRHHRGEIWVTPTTRLLRYRDAHHGLRWATESRPDHDAIVIDAGASTLTSANDLADLTFYCDRPDATRVYVEKSGRRTEIPEIRRNPPDETQRQSVTIAPTNVGPDA